MCKRWQNLLQSIIWTDLNSLLLSLFSTWNFISKGFATLDRTQTTKHKTSPLWVLYNVHVPHFSSSCASRSLNVCVSFPLRRFLQQCLFWIFIWRAFSTHFVIVWPFLSMRWDCCSCLHETSITVQSHCYYCLSWGRLVLKLVPKYQSIQLWRTVDLTVAKAKYCTSMHLYVCVKGQTTINLLP